MAAWGSASPESRRCGWRAPSGMRAFTRASARLSWFTTTTSTRRPSRAARALRRSAPVFERTFLSALAWFVARLPFAWLRGLGALLGWLAGSLLRIRRAHVETAMLAAGVSKPKRTAQAMYANLGAGVAELLWLSRHGPTALIRNPQGFRWGAWGERRRSPHRGSIVSIDPASRALIQRARALGRGIVLAASHTGNWELAACTFAQSVELHVVAKELRV